MSFFASLLADVDRKADEADPTSTQSRATQAQKRKRTASQSTSISRGEISVASTSSYFHQPLNLHHANLGKMCKQGDRTAMDYTDGPRSSHPNGGDGRLNREFEEAVEERDKALRAIERHEVWRQPRSVDRTKLDGVTGDWVRRRGMLLGHARELGDRVRRVREEGTAMGLPGWTESQVFDDDEDAEVEAW
ncbi:hypothetical protein B0A55_03340 [Friedmanniomyces simplex]|uniref:Uncharacterized protein n=1 Tax=Friedmanniomyces simplex TaxID=329884 RepID=A0A4U0XQL8_9PEZI|nr:hypothetical protein B0A55_03340 [Friedmanniomyces simplex]